MARWKGESAMRESSSMGFVHLNAKTLDEKRIRSNEAALLHGLTTFVSGARYGSFAGAGVPRSASRCAIWNIAAMKKPARGGLIQSAGVQGDQNAGTTAPLYCSSMNCFTSALFRALASFCR